MIGFAVLILILSAFIVHEVNPLYRIFSGKIQSNGMDLTSGITLFGIFIFEMLIFGVLTAVPIFMSAWNRGAYDTVNGAKETALEFLLIAVKFCGLHVLLQLSGFYKYIYNRPDYLEERGLHKVPVKDLVNKIKGLFAKEKIEECFTNNNCNNYLEEQMKNIDDLTTEHLKGKGYSSETSAKKTSNENKAK
jgi:hypothetical protein